MTEEEATVGALRAALKLVTGDEADMPRRLDALGALIADSHAFDPTHTIVEMVRLAGVFAKLLVTTKGRTFTHAEAQEMLQNATFWLLDPDTTNIEGDTK